jgi:hypothetical protein
MTKVSLLVQATDLFDRTHTLETDGTYSNKSGKNFFDSLSHIVANFPSSDEAEKVDQLSWVQRTGNEASLSGTQIYRCFAGVTLVQVNIILNEISKSGFPLKSL